MYITFLKTLYVFYDLIWGISVFLIISIWWNLAKLQKSGCPSLMNDKIWAPILRTSTIPLMFSEQSLNVLFYSVDGKTAIDKWHLVVRNPTDIAGTICCCHYTTPIYTRPIQENGHCLRKINQYETIECNTNRYKHSFVPFCLDHFHE